ncbi:Coagulation factor VIII [Merluccius polli]|uniref:Coagulation factor VIII n=1 Tax=Merluccius polli TaxID=89951 RepID=A0AA47MEE7_MERPO|nr:Coagulation factor VIII [Merluccius polli]
MRALLLLLGLPLICALAAAPPPPSPPPPNTRHFYIAAVEIGWDYVFVDRAGPASEPRQRSKDAPQKYIKAVYREYTDRTYSTPTPRPAWAGIQGPVIHAQAGDRLVVHFKNLASQAFSISPVGITYWKQAEGAGYEDSTAGQEKQDDAVSPGGYYEYVWDISPKDGPTSSDPECLTYSYSSQVDTVRDINSGLVGALLICKSSAFRKDGERKSPEFVLLFAVFDERKSWYGEVGERKVREKFRNTGGQKEYHTINGYINTTLPGLTMCQKHSHVFWHLIGVGTAPEIHSIQFQDHSLQVMSHRKITMEMTPMTFTAAEMKPTTQGHFLISCRIHAHRNAGMSAMFTVEDCPAAPAAASPILRNVKQEYYDDYSMFNTIEFKPPMLQARSSWRPRSHTRTHYIAAEEVTWNYAPHLKPTDRELQSQYFHGSPQRLGFEYKKVVFVEYTNATFTKRKSSTQTLLGPLLKGEVNDMVYIIFKNLASRPFNIYPTGLISVQPLKRSQNKAEKDLRSMGVPPNGTFGYVWRLSPDSGPMESDPQCLIQLYQSTVDSERDLASGLVGTLLICKDDTIDHIGRLVGPDNEMSMMFAVFDENRSWYINENIHKYSLNTSKVDPNDPDFYNSNIIYSVNGAMFRGREFAVCQGDVTFWYVVNVGTQSDFLSVYFTGNPFKHLDVYRTVLTLFPMTGEIVPMAAELTGEWEISAFDSNLKSRGMSVRYTVKPCDTNPQMEDQDDRLDDYIDDLDNVLAAGPRAARKSPGAGRLTAGSIPWEVLEEVEREERRASPDPDGVPLGGQERGRKRRQAADHEEVRRDERDGGSAMGEARGDARQTRDGMGGPVDGYDRTDNSLAQLPLSLESEDYNRTDNSTAQLALSLESEDYNRTDDSTAQLPLSLESEDYNRTDDSTAQLALSLESEDYNRTDDSTAQLPLSLESEDYNRTDDSTAQLALSLESEDYNRTDDSTAQLPLSLESEDYNRTDDSTAQLALSLESEDYNRTDDSTAQLALSLESEDYNRTDNSTAQLPLSLESEDYNRTDIRLAQLTLSLESKDYNRTNNSTAQLPLSMEYEDYNRTDNSTAQLPLSLESEDYNRTDNSTVQLPLSLESEDYNRTDIRLAQLALSMEYDDYSSTEENDTYSAYGMRDYIDPRSGPGDSKYRNYYIAAEEVTWDYGIRIPHQLIKPREMRRGMRKFLPEYKKVVFRAYRDANFLEPVSIGELQEHLGIMGPFIRAEVNDLLTVTFKNKASRPYSFHLQGVYDRSQGGGMDQTQTSSSPPGVPGEAVPPGESRVYNWRITKKQGPTDEEFDCKAGAYYSTVNKEKDLHSGLIGPLIICKSHTLDSHLHLQANIQEYALLFHSFDETKSWYIEENLQRHCVPPCEAIPEDPWFQISNKFAAINGYVAETLPGLLMAQHQKVRWHLLNVGSDEEYHAVHFHGLPFNVHMEKEHRMGVYNLYPGVFGTVEMYPPTVGTWLVECTVGDYQLAGMRAKMLVYNPRSWEPRLARLDLTGSINAWMGKSKKSWLQVDVGRPTLVHGLQTQGVRARLRDYFISHYSLSYSLDALTWNIYRGNCTDQKYIFKGNSDSSSVKTHKLSPPILARYVRITPLSLVKHPALRLELLGCDLNSCSMPLGLERKTIPDKSFDASSVRSSWIRAWSPSLARLHQEGSVNAWRPNNNNPHEWLQVDLLKLQRITGLVTQGAKSLLTEMIVTEFAVTVSHDGRSWSTVLEDGSNDEKIFSGSDSPDTESLSLFEPPLFGRYLRVHPRGWINDIALRLEVLGCETQQGAYTV